MRVGFNRFHENALLQDTFVKCTSLTNTFLCFFNNVMCCGYQVLIYLDIIFDKYNFFFILHFQCVFYFSFNFSSNICAKVAPFEYAVGSLYIEGYLLLVFLGRVSTNKISSHICTECIEGKYGTDCKHTCSNNCYGDSPCNQVTGRCLKGCKDGYRGGTCDQG